MAEVDYDELAAQYGWTKAVLDALPEIKKIIKQWASLPDGTDARLKSMIQDSKWYKTHSASERSGFFLRKTDPAEYSKRFASMSRHVMNMFAAMGGGKGLGTSLRKAITTQAVMLGWTDEELKAALAKTVNYSKLIQSDRLGGEAGQLEDGLRKAAADYGVTVTDAWLTGQVKSAMMGTSDLTVSTHALRRMAQSQYRAYADDLERGATMKDIAEPYIQQMAKELELNPGELGLNDNLIRKALTAYDPDSGKPTTTPLWQFQQTLRNDPRWNKTQGAQDSLMGVGHDVLTSMGLAT